MSALNTSRNNIDLRRKIVIGYYILVALLGIWTITRPGSDIMTIYVFLKGEGNPQLNAFIQSTVYNLIFESLALWGSIVIIFLVLKDKKYNKVVIVIFQLVLIISLVMYWIELYYGVIRPYFPVDTNIYSMIETSQIIEHIFSSNSIIMRIIFLTCGIFVSSIILKKAKQETVE